jgi:hypothetical protein
MYTQWAIVVLYGILVRQLLSATSTKEFFNGHSHYAHNLDRLPCDSQKSAHGKCPIIAGIPQDQRAIQKLASFSGLVLRSAHVYADLAWSQFCRG